ncbi:alpha/beta fold hydrolase [Asticcacaulis sp. AC402]|uniref:alpha/beta fold hydrolase n=1 Tax=Asticcacaulis sp. AC402 TaxID=1282361 RepID=UPI0003C3E806|nr:alpha/beta hydrolase [Asticcacaulis sp. AC402]ESQ73671.1 proline iminopeptidase [Asticcacaulis sp. AC402]
MYRAFLTTVLSAVLLSLAPGVQAQIQPENICPSPMQKLDEKGFVQIGGIPQWVTIKGDRCDNPIVLIVHGGPGNPMSPFSDAIYGGWETDYTVVQWDQRGAGMTWGKNRPSEDTPLTIAQMRDDGIEVARYLTQRVGKRKVILVGGSWSSILAIHMIKAEPELFAAYLGSAQMVSYRDNPAATYAFLLDRARVSDDQDSLTKLEKIGPPPWSDPRSFGILRRIDRKYEAQATDPAPADWWQPAADYATPQAQDDYTAGEDYSYIQFVGWKGDGMFSKVDLPALGTEFKVPIFLLQGEADYLTLPDISRRYFDSLTAPQKAFVILPRTGHDPNALLVDAQLKLLNESIRPLAQ